VLHFTTLLEDQILKIFPSSLCFCVCVCIWGREREGYSFSVSFCSERLVGGSVRNHKIHKRTTKCYV